MNIQWMLMGFNKDHVPTPDEILTWYEKQKIEQDGNIGALWKAGSIAQKGLDALLELENA